MRNCAVIGLRNRGKSIVREIGACDGLQVSHLCDTDEQRLMAAREHAPAARLVADAQEVFADPAVDAVFLVLPNHLHLPLGEAALAAGKHVYMEKPMARDVDECRKLIAARDAADRVLMVGYQQRFSAMAYQARALLEAGTIGRITSARARWNRRVGGDGLWGRGDWFMDPKTGGGGPFIDLGVHKLDLCLDLLGYPRIERCIAVARHGLGQRAAEACGRSYGIEDAMDVWLFTDGLDVKVEASYFRNQEEEEYHDIELLGEYGGLRIDGRGLRAWTVAEDGSLQDVDCGDEPGCTASEHFVAVLDDRLPLRTSPEQSLALQQTIDGCYRSAAEGSALIDLAAEEVQA